MSKVYHTRIKDRNRKDKYKSCRKHKRKGFQGRRPQQAENGENFMELSEAENHNNMVVVEIPSCSTSRVSELPVISEQNTSVMSRKQTEELTVSPMKDRLTRKRKRESSLLSANTVSPIDGYKIIDSSILQNILNTA